MTIVCPRCASPNSRWEKRCYACWLAIDAALRTGAQAPAQRMKSSPQNRQTAAAHSAPLTPFTGILGIEAEHVRALAAADIRTLEEIVQAPAETIEDVLRVCTPVDPEILIARAQQQLHSGETSEKKDLQPAPTLVNEPNPDEWWKIR